MPRNFLHTTPPDIKTTIEGDVYIKKLWNEITPLARSEWICWVTSGKLAETRTIRLKKMVSKMKSGTRRPCCWAGCPHRK